MSPSGAGISLIISVKIFSIPYPVFPLAAIISVALQSIRSII